MGGQSLTHVADAWPTWAEAIAVLTLRAGYNTRVVVIGTTLLGLAAGVVGVFTLLRKRSLTTDALSHATLPGIAIAFMVATLLEMDGRSLPILLTGATVTGVLGMAAIEAILRTTRLREDAAIGIVLSVFFGAGVVLLSWIQKNMPGAAGIDAFIYGQTAAMTAGDAWLMAVIAGVAIIAAALLLKEMTIICFNDAFARTDGWPVLLVDGLMMSLVIIVTVAGLQAVGLILVVAMLIIPAVAARFWTDRMWLLVVLAGAIGAFCGYFGSSLSALMPRKPAGAVIVLTGGAVFAFSLLVAPSRGVVASSLRRLRMKLRIASEHVLEAGHDRATAAPGGAAEARLASADLDGIARLRGWSPWFRRLVVFALDRGGRIRRSDGDVVLTERGRADGARIARNHALWEAYLVRYADLAPSHVDWSVDQVEHVLSEELVRELESALAEAPA